MSNNIFTNINLFVHNLLKNIVLPGDHVIDATVGNGNDTLFLAQQVGNIGRVYGFDIQDTAIANSNLLLSNHGVTDRVKIIHAGHENMLKYITTSVKTVMFNLGYLPKGDRNIVTLPGTTVSALRQAVQLLLPGGVITIIVYSGHKGGPAEGKVVEEFIKSLPKSSWDILSWSFLNRNSTAPYLYVLHRRGGQ